jgi:hypothetical protein
VSAAASPATTAEALRMLTSAMSYLATTDPTQLAASEQAQCLRTLEQIDAMETAARASILGAFTAGKGYCDDAAYSPRSWLIHDTHVTKGTATRHIAWVRRVRAHPRIVPALAAGELTESYAATVCQWTDQLPEDGQDNADAILIEAARMGMDLRDLAALAAEIQARADPGTGDDDDPAPVFEDRAVRLETTFGGAGVMAGDLTRSARPSSARCLTPCPPRAARKTPAATSSATMTPSRTPCGGWSARTCCPSGPGSPRKSWPIFPWLTCSTWT